MFSDVILFYQMSHFHLLDTTHFCTIAHFFVTSHFFVHVISHFFNVLPHLVLFDGTFLYTWYNSFACDVTLSCAMSHFCVCDVILYFLWCHTFFVCNITLFYVWCHTFVCVISHFFMCDATLFYVWYHTFFVMSHSFLLHIILSCVY